ncbi:hypothetical protein ACC808_37140, partial [Rhizobium ruizarguesonis]
TTLRPAPRLITCALTNMIAMIVLAYPEQLHQRATSLSSTGRAERLTRAALVSGRFRAGPHQLRQISDLTVLFKIV